MRTITNAEIVAVGSELLTPHRVDTNSLFLTGRLNDLGIEVRTKAVVGDDRAVIADVIRAALSRADLVITTGGLGPTADDLTREVIADVLGLELEEDGRIVDLIRARFDRRGLRMPDINRRQAMVPRGATVLPNPNGTAPGLLIAAGDRVVALLPGPPRELQPMFNGHVAEFLAARTGGSRLRRRVIKIHGRSESQVEEISFPIYSGLGTPDVVVETTILATPGQIELHLAGRGTDVDAVDKVLDDGVRRLVAALGDVVFSDDGRTLEVVVADALLAGGLTIAVAESCTGGMCMSRLTDVPGSSTWMVGGVVAYSNVVKTRDLGVSASTIAADGAVSESVACAMAEGVRARFGSSVGVGITGIAGPAGGSPDKPVGMVVIAVAAASTAVRTFQFPGDREMVRRFATSAALDMVRRALS